MQKLTKVITAIMLIVAVICAAGCKKAPVYNINILVSPVASGVVTGNGLYEEGQSCTVNVKANDGYQFVNWTEDGNTISIDANYTFSVTGNRILVAHFDPASVDLGLPSGTLWALCNIGANAPEDYGDLFAWGETETKDSYNLSTYKWRDGIYDQLTKYCNDSFYGYNGFADNLTVLAPEDDAATANWGGDWRMPTREEWDELLNNTTNTWTTQNGVYGRLFTASNGASLFLPAAGWRQDDGLCLAGSDGYYWSSSLYTNDPYFAWYIFFHSDCCAMSNYRRSNGRSVRAVLPASKN